MTAPILEVLTLEELKMKKIIVATAMALSVLVPSVSALDVGIGFAAGASNANEATGIRVPLDFDFGLRIEPELGFSKHLTTVAVGGYYSFMKVEQVNLFAGGRMGITLSDYPTDPTGFSLQALAGAEYFVVEDKFSVAAQVGLESASGDLNNNFGTIGAVVGRFFF